jgi:hypothetical protein
VTAGGWRGCVPRRGPVQDRSSVRGRCSASTTPRVTVAGKESGSTMQRNQDRRPATTSSLGRGSAGRGCTLTSSGRPQTSTRLPWRSPNPTGGGLHRCSSRPRPIRHPPRRHRGTRAVGAPRRRQRAWRLVAPAVTLAVGLLLGYALGAARADGELSSVTATRAPATRPPAAPVTSIVVRPTASPACRETVTRADQLIDLLVRNRRSAAADLLVAYTVASRQCRRDASP